jgi:uncharacterized Ntn-hydrolase superfamily protein
MSLRFTSAFRALTLTLLLLALRASSVEATYSIIACDAKTRACGVAVQTNNLAVGASVPYAQAGVGALVSQFETNPNYGPRGLALLAQGKAPEEVLKQLLADDGNFEGQGPEARQVAIVSLDGKTAVHTGEEAQRADWAGALSGSGYSVQGNSLVSANVIAAMEQAFLKNPGTLGERLLAALSAGDAAGGQRTGRESAALLVKTPDGWPIDVDLRVDHSADPVGDLRMLFNMQSARQQINQARRAAGSGDLQAARALTIQAVARASMWPRIWLQAAHVAIDIEEPELALQYLNVAFSQNPAWAEAEIGDGTYATLGRNPLFHKWVPQGQEENTLAAYRSIKSSTVSSRGEDDTRANQRDSQFKLASRLLEVGHSEEALVILRALLPAIANASVKDAAELHSLLADGYAAQGDLAGAIEHAQAAARLQPSNVAAGKKTLVLQAELVNRR